MRFFIEKKLFNDELMNSFLANDNECTHDITELDHLAPLGARLASFWISLKNGAASRGQLL